MGLLNLLLESPTTFLLVVIPLLYAVIFHEIAHGLAAYFFGDPTAKLMGRLSLNPLKHLDPMGTIMLFIFGFGWARPVPVNFSYIGNNRGALIAVSAAGIVTNLILAFLALFFLQLTMPAEGTVSYRALVFFAYINIILASLNLIPLPPLDGSKILMGFLPRSIQEYIGYFEHFGFLIVILLLFMGVLTPIIHLVFNILYGLIAALLPG